jgi:hypothetical protein
MPLIMCRSWAAAVHLGWNDAGKKINGRKRFIVIGTTRHTATTLALARRVMTASQPRAKRNAQSHQRVLTKYFFT